jgi:hypothetical protein
MRNKKQKIMILSMVLSIMLVGTASVNALSIYRGTNSDTPVSSSENEKTKNANKYDEKYEDWVIWYPNGMECDNMPFWEDWDYIYYSMTIDNFDQIDTFDNVYIGIEYKAEIDWPNEGPDILAKKPGSADYDTLDQGIGESANLRWYWTGVSNDYVDSNGKIEFGVLCAACCHCYLDTVGIRWTVTNYKPKVNSISYSPLSPTRNQDVTLTGNTVDDDGTVEAYKWMDGGQEIGSTNPCVVKFSTSGTHSVTLQVKDNDGGWSSESEPMDIEVSNNIAPVMNSISPDKGAARKELTFTFTASDSNNDKVRFFILWDSIDNPTDGVWTEYFSCEDGVITGTVDYEYILEGTYNIKVKASDIYGGESQYMSLDFTAPKSKTMIKSIVFQLFEKTPLLVRICSLLELF